MSYSTWHNYGYGVKTTAIKEEELSVDRIKNLLNNAPEFKNEIEEYFKEVEIKEPTVDDYLEFDQDFRHGIAFILRSVIEENTGISLSSCDSYDGDVYLMYTPSYPCEMDKTDIGLTEDIIKELLNEYLGIICDTIPQIDYQTCENGG